MSEPEVSYKIMSTNITEEYFFISDDLSNETAMTIVTVNIVALVGAISMFGIASNVLSIMVFSKQGFSETTNISFTALAVSDLLSLMATLCISIFWNPWFLNSGLPLEFMEIQMAFGLTPYACFSRITGLLTAFATFERCLCVIWPLMVKRILTPKVTICSIVSIFVITFLTMAPFYSTLTLGWSSEPWTNMTFLRIIAGENDELLSNISYLIDLVIQLVAFCAVSIFTVVLINCPRQKTAWRKQQTETQNAIKNATKRQDKAIKMVTIIAVNYIIGYLPTVVTIAVKVPYPSFGPFGRYKNNFFVFWSFSVLCRVLNSSVNLLLYYVMSSKFRQTFDKMLSGMFRVEL